MSSGTVPGKSHYPGSGLGSPFGRGIPQRVLFRRHRNARQKKIVAETIFSLATERGVPYIRILDAAKKTGCFEDNSGIWRLVYR